MSDYIFEIGLFCFAMTLVGIVLTMLEFRQKMERVEARRARPVQNKAR